MVEAFDKEKLSGKAELILPDHMTHSSIDPYRHLTEPILKFLAKLGSDGSDGQPIQLSPKFFNS